MNLFRRRSVADLQAEVLTDQRLKRALGPVNLTALGIGAVIGAGIFVLTGHAAAELAGPGIVLSFILAGIACALAGLCYAELSAMIPISGSAYTYGYATLGEFVAWIIGWDLILEYLFAASTVAVGWSGYAVSFLYDLGISIPKLSAAAGTQLIEIPKAVAQSVHMYAGWWIAKPELLNQIKAAGIDPATLTHVTAAFNVPAVIIVFVITLLLVVGIRESAIFNNVIVIIKMLVILAVVGVGALYINKANWHPFIPENTGKWGEFGWSGVLRAAGVIFFAYIGFDAVSTAAQEAKRPQRDMPIGILGSLAICTVLYIAVSLVLTGVISYTQLDGPAPIATAVDSLGSSRCVASADCKNRRDRRAFICNSRDDARPAANFLYDVQGRPASAGVQRGASEIPHAVDCTDNYRRLCDAHGSSVSNRTSGRVGFNRDAPGVRHCVRWRLRAPFYRPEIIRVRSARQYFG